ncbi:serine hydrolase [Streptomyces zhihengii]|uniref:Serine hydrolase n=1 Tax=Streptomyces zhihengii TaxID=1818004 RepID=A0ABS2UU62_9ACTN|nr:serine hydrolase [Streptomyces zhihengii]MBM9620980.1 serine hydrolase [Streptomyces zhihengii]
MAGESPDKSEQRKSSGETTGSERDPRLAMFREGSPASPASSEPSPPSSAATDERTAVFRLPPRDRAETAGATAGEAPAGASADAEPGDGDADASAPSAGVPAGAAGDGGVTDASASASASSDDEPSGTATDDEAAEEERGADSGAGSDTEAAEAGSGAGADAEAEAEAPEGGSDADSVSGAAGTRNAPDADADAHAAPEKPEDGADRTAAKPAVDATADDAGDDANDDASDDASASSSDAPAGDERLRAAVAAWVATGDDEPGDGSESAGTPQKASPEAAQAPEADGTAPGDAEKGRAPAAGSEPTSSADGDDDEVPSSDASDAEDDDAPATAAAEEASAPAPKSTPDADGSGDTDTDSGKTPAGDTPAVDQPTAVFKAPKRPVVDQPTTALKLPKPASDPEPATPAGAEADSERTSTFVPLRRDDARPAAAGAAARPKPAAPAANAPAAPAAKAGTAKATTAEADAPAASLTEAERTRQQPMPPLPPLDLLAELTNTPPPPETPTRTVVRRIKIWTPLVALLLIVFAIAQALRPLPQPELTLTADAEYTFDGGRPSLPWPDEGQGQIVVSGVGVVGQFGDEKPVPIASVTKTMTAYIIMRDHPLKRGEDGESIPVDALAEKEGGYDETNDESTLNTIKEGDTISVRDALSAIMIPSANNVARLVARWDAGSEEAFVKKMNDTAKDLGMTNTTYTDPSGLDATTVSTAADQVKLGQALVKNKAMVDITRVQEWYDPSGKRHSNYNTLMPRNGAIGIKTGSTTKAGGNLLFAAYKDIGGSTQTIVGAVLSQHESPILETVNRVSEEVLVATREALLEQKVVKKGDVVGYVDDGLGGQTPVVATKDLTIVGWTGLKLEASITDGGKKLPHTAEAGTVVGSLTAGTGPGTISVPVALQQDLVEPGFGDKLTRIG